MTSFIGPLPMLIMEAVGGGREVEGGPRAWFNKPRGVEEGVMFCGSETVRNEGTRLGKPERFSEGPSSGVLASDESAEPGDAGLLRPSLSTKPSGVAGNESGVLRSVIAESGLSSQR